MHCSQEPGVPSAALLPVGASLWSAGSEMASQMEAHHPERVTATGTTYAVAHRGPFTSFTCHHLITPFSPLGPRHVRVLPGSLSLQGLSSVPGWNPIRWLRDLIRSPEWGVEEGVRVPGHLWEGSRLLGIRSAPRETPREAGA